MTLQSVVDQIPNASSGGGGGSSQTILANNITLSTSAQNYISLNNGSTYYTITAPAGSTSTVGMVQLSNATDSTSTSLAATPSAVKAAYDHVSDAILKSIGTDAGDIIYFTGSGSPTVLPKGTAGQVLTMNSGATAPTWATPSSGGNTTAGKTVTLSTTGAAVLTVNGTDSGSVALPAGSTSQVGVVQLTNSTSSTSTTTAATPNSVKTAYDLAAAAIPKSTGAAAGDIIYFTAASTPTRLAKGTAGQVLTMNSGATAPTWATPSSGGGGTQVTWSEWTYN